MSDVDKDFVKSLMNYNEKSKELSTCTGALTALKRIELRANGLAKEHIDGDYYIRKKDLEDIIESEKEHILVKAIQL